MKRREKYGTDQRGWSPAIGRETYEHTRGMTGRGKERDEEQGGGLIYTTGDRFGACNIGHHTTIRHVYYWSIWCAYRRDVISLPLCLSSTRHLYSAFSRIRVSCCVRVVNLRRVLGPTKSPPSLGRGVIKYIKKLPAQPRILQPISFGAELQIVNHRNHDGKISRSFETR